jgi:Holliday junction resolvase
MTNIRRSRGYSFEHGLVEKLNNTPNWMARRLGGSSTGLPDIVATNNVTNTLLTIECKSTQGNTVYVPPDQVERCAEVCKLFSVYKTRHIIFAFKFMRNANRKLRYFFKRADTVMLACRPDLITPTYRCGYDGKVYEMVNRKVQEADYILDFPEFRQLMGPKIN